MRYHPTTEALLQTAARKARDLGHSYVGSAHLLLALTLEAGDMGLVLRQLGVEPELTEALALLLYGAGTPDLPLPQGLTEEARALLRESVLVRGMQDTPSKPSSSRSSFISGAHFAQQGRVTR